VNPAYCLAVILSRSLYSVFVCRSVDEALLQRCVVVLTTCPDILNTAQAFHVHTAAISISYRNIYVSSSYGQ